MVRAILFYLTTTVLIIATFIVGLILQLLVLLFDKHRRRAQHFVDEVWATLTTCMFCKTEVEGWENLPAADEGAVYVTNHQLLQEIYTLFELRRPFKFISKTSNFLIPFIGWCMYLAGHITVKRMDKWSQLDYYDNPPGAGPSNALLFVNEVSRISDSFRIFHECMRTRIRLVKEGVSVLFFPEETRTTDGAMAAFKNGAFVVVVKGSLPIVPITIIESGKLMPNGLEYTLRFQIIKVIVHPSIYSESANALCDQSQKIIVEILMFINIFSIASF